MEARSTSRRRSRSRSRSPNRARSRSSKSRKNKFRGKKGLGRSQPVALRPPPDVYGFPHPKNLASLSFIHPNLYLTCLEGAQRCQGNDFAIVAAGTRFTTDYMEHHPAAYRAFVIAADTPHMDQDDFASIFGKGADLMNRALSLNKVTILHCRAGINRSVALALAYVKRYTDLDVNEMLRKVRAVNVRKRALPALINRTFAKHLGPFR